MPLSLPPLNALRSFEVAARYGSYVGAARELGVTAAAVSQQVRNLEEHLQRQLFTRFNNRIVLTDAGTVVYAQTEEALGLLSGMAERLKSTPARSRLVVSVLPSLAEAWFLPHLATLKLSGTLPGLDIRLQDDNVDFASDDIDLRLCYGEHLYPDKMTVPLFSDEVVPLCAPGYLESVGSDFGSVADRALIHTNWGRNFATLPGWADWFNRYMPERQPDLTAGHRVGTSWIALEMARAGLGIALGQRHLASHFLASGALVEANRSSLPLGHSYAAVVPYSKAKRGELKTMLDWLVRISTNEESGAAEKCFT